MTPQRTGFTPEQLGKIDRAANAFIPEVTRQKRRSRLREIHKVAPNMPQVRDNASKMSALPGGIGPLSVRYAAQIRELLQSRAIERMAAEQEAARNAAQEAKAERMKPVAKPVKAALEVKSPVDAKPRTKAAPEPPAARTTAQIVDVQI